MSIDINRIAASAVDSFLNGREVQPQDRPEENGNRGLGGVGSLALGAGLALAARAAYSRVRKFDLQEVGRAVEDRIAG